MQDAPVSATQIVSEPEGTRTELTDIPIVLPNLGVDHNRVLRKPQLADLPPARRGTLISLTYDLFVGSWQQIVFGSVSQGAVFELMLSAEPALFSYLDGYLTIGLSPSPSHMHLCVGPHQGLKRETPSALAQRRQCARAAFARSLDRDGDPMSWSVQLWNGAGESMITFFLPSPYLDEAREKRLREPDYGKLALWDSLRRTYLGEQTPQPLPPNKRGTMCGG